MIDSYSWQARVAPLLIAVLPVLLLGAVVLPRLTVLERIVTLAVLIALLPLLDQLGRARCRRCEPAVSKRSWS